MEPSRFEIARVPDGAFVSDAGWIANIALGEYRCVSLIFSRAGSRRSRHYHRTDAHLLYVVSGEMHYWERPVGLGQYGPAEVVRSGQHVWTGPMLVHQTFFPVDTLLVSASKLPRDHESHESDVVRVEEAWIDA